MIFFYEMQQECREFYRLNTQMEKSVGQERPVYRHLRESQHKRITNEVIKQLRLDGNNLKEEIASLDFLADSTAFRVAGFDYIDLDVVPAWVVTSMTLDAVYLYMARKKQPTQGYLITKHGFTLHVRLDLNGMAPKEFINILNNRLENLIDYLGCKILSKVSNRDGFEIGTNKKRIYQDLLGMLICLNSLTILEESWIYNAFMERLKSKKNLYQAFIISDVLVENNIPKDLPKETIASLLVDLTQTFEVSVAIEFYCS